MLGIRGLTRNRAVVDPNENIIPARVPTIPFRQFVQCPNHGFILAVIRVRRVERRPLMGEKHHLFSCLDKCINICQVVKHGQTVRVAQPLMLEQLSPFNELCTLR